MGRISYTGALLLKALFSSTVCCCRALYLGSSETRVYIPQALSGFSACFHRSQAWGFVVMGAIIQNAVQYCAIACLFDSILDKMASLLEECQELFNTKDLYKIFKLEKGATQEKCELMKKNHLRN